MNKETSHRGLHCIKYMFKAEVQIIQKSNSFYNVLMLFHLSNIQPIKKPQLLDQNIRIS